MREVLQKYPLVLLLLLLPHHPNLPLVSLHLVVPLHPYPVQAHLVVSRLKILLLVQRVLRFLSPPSSSEAPSESPASSVTEKKSISVSWNENYIRCKDVVTDSDKQVYVPGQGYTWGYHHYYLDIIYNITNTGNCPISLGNDAFSVAWDDEPLTDHFVYLNAQLIDPVKLSEGESAMVAVRYPISAAKYEEFSDLFAIAPHRIIHTVTFEESNFTYTYLTKLYSSNM